MMSEAKKGEPPKKHCKVYQRIGDTLKNVGRGWTNDFPSLALRLGTRGLPRKDCTVYVVVQPFDGDVPESSKYECKISQTMVELTPSQKKKKLESGDITEDGKKKFKKIISSSWSRSSIVENDENKNNFSFVKPPPGYDIVPCWKMVKTSNKGYVGFSDPWRGSIE